MIAKEGVKLPKQQIVDLTKEGIEVKISTGNIHLYGVTNGEAKLITLDANSWLTALTMTTECKCGHSSEHSRIVVKVVEHRLSQYNGCEYDVCSLDFEPVDEAAHITKLLKQSGIELKTNKKSRWQNLETMSLD